MKKSGTKQNYTLYTEITYSNNYDLRTVQKNYVVYQRKYVGSDFYESFFDGNM